MPHGWGGEINHPREAQSKAVASPQWRERVEVLWASDKNVLWVSPFGGFLHTFQEGPSSLFCPLLGAFENRWMGIPVTSCFLVILLYKIILFFAVRALCFKLRAHQQKIYCHSLLCFCTLLINVPNFHDFRLILREVIDD